MTEIAVSCGAALVQRLLPQRPPFLFVDRLDAITPGERPAARASRFLTVNEPFFQGHFPDLPILPGALMLEGVGQTSSLAYTMGQIADAYVERGSTVQQLVDDLAELDGAFSLRHGFASARVPAIAEAFERLKGRPVGVAGEVRIKFLRPVVPGCRLVYTSKLTHRLGDQLRFEVAAHVDGEPVMQGSLSAAVVAGPPMGPGRAP